MDDARVAGVEQSAARNGSGHARPRRAGDRSVATRLELAKVGEELGVISLGTFGPVLLVEFQGVLTNKGMDLYEGTLQEHCRRWPTVSTLSLVNSTQTRSLPPDLNARMHALTRLAIDRRVGDVVVIETTGLTAVIARAVLATMSLMSAMPMKVHRDLASGVASLRALPRQLPEVRDRADLQGQLEPFFVGRPRAPATAPASRP